jgi:hypothetical protein
MKADQNEITHLYRSNKKWTGGAVDKKTIREIQMIGNIESL